MTEHHDINEDFDTQWYRKRYPDVIKSGLDPRDHYLWLGRRLGRFGAPPKIMGRDGLVGGGSFAGGGQANLSDHGRRGPNTDVDMALRNLCWWLADGHGGRCEYLFQRMAPNFWHMESDSGVRQNANGLLLSEFMQRFRTDVDLDAVFLLPKRLNPPTRSVLLVSYYAPSMSHAGGLRILDVYTEMRRRYPDVRLTLFAGRNEAVDGDVSMLDDIFDSVHFCEPGQFNYETLAKQVDLQDGVDVLDLQFHKAGVFAAPGRAWAKRVLFTPMEVLSRFDFDIVAKAVKNGEVNKDKFFSLVHRGVDELRIMQEVDATVCVSDADAGFLAHVSGSSSVNYFPTGLSLVEFKNELDPRFAPTPVGKKHNRLVFAAYFGSETNVMGLEWYLKNIHEKVLAAVPDYDLAVVGRGDTSSLERLKAKSVRFIGEVPILSPVLQQAKAGLVLAINGSGFRGKINQYSICGLPTVSTNLGATGLVYEPDEEIVLADEPDDFAAACIEILRNDQQTEKLAEAARKRALSTYTWDAIWGRIAALYGFADGTSADG
jgi:glycosyltransferase involved in cell wall biosynthesis